MNKNLVTQGLQQAFFTEQHRIVFWYDPDQDYIEELNEFALPDVQLINMQSESALAIKFCLELEDTTGKYLLYFPQTEPAAIDDWLLDMKLYSRRFFADRVSIVFNELCLTRQSVRQHLQQRKTFLASKERIKRLKRWVQPGFDEQEVDLAIIAAIVRAESCDVAGIIYALADEAVRQNTGVLDNPESFNDIQKFGVLPALLRALQAEVGYPVSEEELEDSGMASSFSFGHFMIRLLITEFCTSLSEVPDWAQSLLLKTGTAPASIHALLSRWRDSSRYYPAFDTFSSWVAEALLLEQKLQVIAIETLVDTYTFKQVERQIIVELSQSLTQAEVLDLSRFAAIIGERLDGYWASRHKDDDKRRQYRQIYQALLAAIRLFELRGKYSEGFHFSDTRQLYDAYTNELYQFDQAYRHYHFASQLARVEILKSLDESVEQCYALWYMDQLARNWGDLLEAEKRLNHWALPGVPNQQNFYQQTVRHRLDQHKNKRLVVIISDALRYEAAAELVERINEKRYSQAQLSTQLGVLPSYTSLGMAALLPHNTLAYQEKGEGAVLADGQSTKDTASRNKILMQHNGMAVTAELVKAWSRDAGREALKSQQLIYVYHNVIDARGDTVSTESETFNAVNDAIEELTELTRKIMLHFNTTTVLITADHGFLYQQSKLGAADRTTLTDKPVTGLLKSKKRYVIGKDLPTNKAVWKGSVRETAGTDCNTEFWIPKGANRFHFVGGARFVHGGAMPQEIAVPVITVTQLRGDKKDQRTRRKVDVISPKPMLKVMNNIQRFDLMQTEAVSDQVLPITVSVAIYDGDNRISSEEVVTLDCQTDVVSERIKSVRLSLSGGEFNRNKNYSLIFSDKDLNTEINRYPVKIDLAFTDDFF